MSKKTIFIFIFSIIFFLVALLFFYLVTFTDYHDDKKINNNQSYNIADSSDKINDLPLDEENQDSFDNILNKDLEEVINFSFCDKNGQELELSSFKEKPIVILFSDFFNNSDSSTELINIINSFYNEYKDNTNFLCIDKTKAFDSNSEIVIYKDIDGIQNCNIENVPTLLFITKEGNILNKLSTATIDNVEANLDLITGNF